MAPKKFLPNANANANAANLVIVESAAKAKKIATYLNQAPELKHLGNFQVLACLGHVQDLPAKSLGVNPENWTVVYHEVPGKARVLKALKAAAKTAQRVFLASDPDREGAAIADHLRRVLRLPLDTPRLQFHEITPRALVQAVLNPTRIDTHLVDAQEARRVLDRVVGYEVSPLLWRRFAQSKLSAGRVQSAALQQLVARQAAYDEHVPEKHWGLRATFVLESTPSSSIDALETIGMNVRQDAPFAWTDITSATSYLEHKLNMPPTQTYPCTFQQTPTQKNPPAPFTTSTLQQEAHTRHALSAQTTMRLAQGLYEAGRITYHRTDSTSLAEEAREQIHEAIRARYGADYVKPRTYKTKTANAQEAHEAIRPTHPQEGPQEGQDDLPEKVYALIWKRAIACQMTPAIYTRVSVNINIQTQPISCPPPHACVGTHELLTEPGYLLAAAPNQRPDAAALARWQCLLALGEASVRAVRWEARGNVSRPPCLWNESQLVKGLEKHGIGRPSTYAAIIQKVLERGYAVQGKPTPMFADVDHIHINVCETNKITHEADRLALHTDAKVLMPTPLGQRVAGYLAETHPELLDVAFTARMEGDLDRIARGEARAHDVLTAFYGPFHERVEAAKQVHADTASVTTSSKTKTTKSKSKPTKTLNESSVPSSTVLKAFPNLQAATHKTRFGVALLHAPTQRWVSLQPFLEWQKKGVEDLNDRDVAFLLALPIKRGDTGDEVHMGRYGLYVKTAKGKNERLEATSWDEVAAPWLEQKSVNGV